MLFIKDYPLIKPNNKSIRNTNINAGHRKMIKQCVQKEDLGLNIMLNKPAIRDPPM